MLKQGRAVTKGAMEASEGVSYQSGDLSLNGYKKMLFKYFILKIMKNQIYINFICVCFFFIDMHHLSRYWT